MESIIDVFVCCQCKNFFDEFEFNYKAYKADGKIMCNLCRLELDLQYMRKTTNQRLRAPKIYNIYGKTGKVYDCILCGERIPKGSRDVRYKVVCGKRRYMHIDCPVYRQGVLGV